MRYADRRARHYEHQGQAQPDPLDRDPDAVAPPLLASDPGIMGGEPIIRGTRMPARRLLEYLEAGETIDTFLEDYPGVERDDVRAILALLRDTLPALATRVR